MSEMMQFPDTVEEFMEQYKVTDTKHIYSNGMEMVPVFRMKEWFQHVRSMDAVPVVRCQDCEHADEYSFCDYFGCDDFCSHGERKGGDE